MAGFLEALRTSVTNEAPGPREQRRNDLAMIGLILFALFLAWGIRGNSVRASQNVTVDPGLPNLVVPADWLKSSSEQVLFRAVNPNSPSLFDARIEVRMRPVQADDTLDLISVSWPLEQSQKRDRFRSLSSQVVELAGIGPGVLLTFAYVADPTRESGALGLPVVVKGQDLLFLQTTDSGQRLVIVSMEADATEWQTQQDAFALALASLGGGAR